MKLTRMLSKLLLFTLFFAIPTGIFAQNFTQLSVAGLPEGGYGDVKWGDYDNDDDLDLLCTGRGFTEIYENKGGGNFVSASAGLIGLSYSIASWADYDNDGDLDILVSGLSGSDYELRLYNNNAGAFVQVANAITAVAEGDADWADYDGDGDLDLLLSGATAANTYLTRIYRNDNGVFAVENKAIFQNIGLSDISWVDYDGDGKMDVFISGQSSTVKYSNLYRNNGDGSFSVVNNAIFQKLTYCSADWNDYDGDGDPDLLLSGDGNGSGIMSKIYRNDGGGMFTDINAGLAGVYYGQSLWADINNDGMSDVVLLGNNIGKIYKNNGDGTFTEFGSGLPRPLFNAAALGDYDNDGDLDLAVAGWFPGFQTRIFRNNTVTANTVPTTPTGLTATVVGDDITLTWDASADVQTVADELTYNIYLSETSLASTVIPPMSSIGTGFRKVVRAGNCGQKTTITLSGLEKRRYYWSVQAVDNGFKGSAFAAEQSFYAADISLIQPNGGEKLMVGQTYQITWNSQNVEKINLAYNAGSWQDINSSNTYSANIGNFSWNVPDTPSDEVKVRLTDNENPAIWALSDDFFTIADIEITSPNGGEEWMAGMVKNITWTSDFVEKVKLEYFEGGAWHPIDDNIDATTGTYAWTVEDLASTLCKIRITDMDAENVTDESNAVFTISALELLNPVADEVIMVGSNYALKWRSANVSDIRLQYKTHNVPWTDIDVSQPAIPGDYNWSPIPNTPSDQCKIRLVDDDIPANYYESDFVFTIAELSVTSPGAGVSWQQNMDHDIIWSSAYAGNINIDFLDGSGGTTPIAVNIAASSGTVTWPTNVSPTNTGRIKITSVSHSHLTASSGVFTVSAEPMLSLTAPTGGEWIQTGVPYTITWTDVLTSDVNLEISFDNGDTWTVSIPLSGVNTYNYTWINPVSECKVRIVDQTNAFNSSMSGTFVVYTPGMTLRLISPNGGEKVYNCGNPYTIEWEPTASPAQIKLEFSTNGGTNWTLITPTPYNASSGRFDWYLDNIPSADYLIRISDWSNKYYFDLSDDSFSVPGIYIDEPCTTTPELLVSQVYNIRWRVLDVSQVRLEYSTNSGTDWEIINDNWPANLGYYQWAVPNVASTACRLRITDVQNSCFYDWNDCDFTIKGVIVKSPNGGESLIPGMVYDIEWESADIDKVKIEYTTGDDNWITIISETPAAAGTYQWIVPNTPSVSCYVRISDVDNPVTADISDARFAIQSESITVLSPNGNERWATGSSHTVTWLSERVNDVNIKYSIDDGSSWNTIAANVDANLGYQQWTLPATPSVECLVKVEDAQNINLYDVSDNSFRITGAAYPPPASWDYVTHTGSNAIIIVPNNISPTIEGQPIQTDDAIGVFYTRNDSLICAGYSKWIDGTDMAITVWGDNSRTLVKEGFAEGETYRFMAWDGQQGAEYMATVEYNSATFTNGATYSADKISVLSAFYTHREMTIFVPANTWRMISTNLLPLNFGIRSMLKDVENSLDIIKDDLGRAFIPDDNIMSLKEWDMTDGYQILMKNDDSVRFRGTLARTSDYLFNLTANNWYIISYLPDRSQDIATALGAIAGNILMVKNSDGQIYFPQYGIDFIQSMNPGEGYKICTYTSCSFSYGQVGGLITQKAGKKPKVQTDRYYKPIYKSTGNSCVIIAELDNVADGTEVAVINSEGDVIGSDCIFNGSAVITVWGDNIGTEYITEGGIENERLRLIGHNSNGHQSLVIKSLTDLINGGDIEDKKVLYHQDAIYRAVALSGGLYVEHIAEGEMFDCYPIPAVNSLNITLNKECTESTVTLSDQFGRVVRQAEVNTATYSINLHGIVSGIYFVTVSNALGSQTRQVVVMK